MDLRRRLGPRQRRDLTELLPGDDGRERVLDTHGRQPVFGGDAPQQGARIGLVGEHLVDGRLFQRLPAGLGMPSALRVLLILRTLRPYSASSKMRRTTPSAGGFSASFGRSRGPSWTLTLR